MSNDAIPFSLIVAVKDEKENMAPLVGEIAQAMEGRDVANYEAIFDMPSAVKIQLFPSRRRVDNHAHEFQRF